MNQEIQLRKWHLWLAALAIVVTLGLEAASTIRTYASSQAVAGEQILELQKEVSSKADKDVVDQNYLNLQGQIKALQDQQTQNTQLLLQLAEKRQ